MISCKVCDGSSETVSSNMMTRDDTTVDIREECLKISDLRVISRQDMCDENISQSTQ